MGSSPISTRDQIIAMQATAAQHLRPVGKEPDPDDLFCDVMGSMREFWAPGASATAAAPRGSWIQLEVPHSQESGSASRVQRVLSPLILGSMQRPIRIYGDHLPGGGPVRRMTAPAMRCMVFMVDANWDASAYRRAVAKFGQPAADEACAQGFHEVLILRHVCRFDKVAEDKAMSGALLQVCQNIASYMSNYARNLITSSGKNAFMGTAQAHAARLADVPALKILHQGLQYALIDSTKSIEFGAVSLHSLVMWAVVALESRFWKLHPSQSVAVLQWVLEEINATFSPDDPPSQIQEARDLVMRAIIKCRRSEAIYLVANDYHAARKNPAEQESPYLIWTTADGWLEGVQNLLHLGLAADDRFPGAFTDHWRFSIGTLPIVTALSTPGINEAAAVQIAHLLYKHGASPFAAVSHTQVCVAPTERVDAQTCAQRTGLSHRWDAFVRLCPELNDKRKQDALMYNSAATTMLTHLANKSVAGTLHQRAYAVVDALEIAYHLINRDSQISLLLWRPVLFFIQESGALFGEIGRRRRPYISCDIELTDQERRVTAFGKSFDLEESTLEARLSLWAYEGRKLLSQLDQGKANIDKNLATKPSQWVAEISAYLDPEAKVVASNVQMPLLILAGRAQEASKIFETYRAITIKERSLSFLACIIESSRSPKTANQALVVALATTLAQGCNDAPSAAACLEMALRLGSKSWISAMTALISDKKLDLQANDDSDLPKENLLHIAVEGPNKSLVAFIKAIPCAWRSAWLSQQDELGDSPLHRAARLGAAQVKTLLGDVSQDRIKVACKAINQSQRTPALEALLTNQPSAFTYLCRLGDNVGRGEALRDALSARRGVLTTSLLESLKTNPHSESLLRRHANTLGRRLARLGDRNSLEPLLRAYRQLILKPIKDGSSILHSVAQVGNPDMLQLLRNHASPAQLRVLAEHKDSRGNRPEDDATEASFKLELTALRGESCLAQVSVGPARQYAGALRQAIAQVAAQSRSVPLERSVEAFCAQAKEQLAKHSGDAQLTEQINALAWEVAEHIDRAPMEIGMRMGTHLSMHRPDVSDEMLQHRAKSTKTGASRFCAEGGLALLLGRSKAIAQMRRSTLHPGMRLVIDVPCKGLRGYGFKDQAGSLSVFNAADTLRSVFAQSANGPMLVTMYAV